MSVIFSLLFLGGWHFPGVTSHLGGTLVLAFKTVLCCSAFIIVRASLPRYRYDTLMHIGWKVLLPINLVLLVVYSLIMLLF